jgi:hypothetical protein
MHHLTKMIKELNSKNLLNRIGRYVMIKTPIEVADLAFVFGTPDREKSLWAKSGSALPRSFLTMAGRTWSPIRWRCCNIIC